LEVVSGTAALGRPLIRAVVTIGNFDGLHVGHRAILEVVAERARSLRGEMVVYTFDPHPRKVIRPDRAPGLLLTLEQKLEYLEQAGVDVAIVEPFTPEFRETSAEEFVRRYLHERLRPREVYVGYDFHYGKDREGSMRVLTEMGPLLGFSVTIIPEVTIGGRDVNSTRIRALLGEGRVEQAAELLGRPYAIRGRVVEGDRRGRTLGFPTANLAPENELLPAPGVYAADVRFLDAGDPPAGRHFAAVANVGHRPTFHRGDALVAEAHLLDFDADVYDRRAEVSFEARIRSERRFPGPEALRKQIAKDVEEARRRLAPVEPA
jgi:riboflavin kinase/FMN adenylyltransferase